MAETNAKSAPSIFCHSEIDDAGFTPELFRFLHRVARRDGPNGCWESIPSIAKACGMNVKTVKRHAAAAVRIGIVSREERPGFSAVYRITTDEWIRRGKPIPTSTPSPNETTGIQLDRDRLKPVPPARLEPRPPIQVSTPVPTQTEPHKGIPKKESSEGDPTKVIQAGDALVLDYVNTSTTPAVTPEQIYAEYPLKVGKQDALRAINKAARRVMPSVLLERTKAYALAVSRWPEEARQFVPHPATWYNRGSYEDDPVGWERHNLHHKPASRIDHTAGFLDGVPGIDTSFEISAPQPRLLGWDDVKSDYAPRWQLFLSVSGLSSADKKAVADLRTRIVEYARAHGDPKPLTQAMDRGNRQAVFDVLNQACPPNPQS